MTRQRLLVPLIFMVAAAVGSLLIVVVSDSRPTLGLDLQGGFSVVLQAKEVDGQLPSEESVEKAKDIIRQRVDGLGVAEPDITRQGRTVIVQLPGVKNREKAESLVGNTARLEFCPVLSVAANPDAPTTTAEGDARVVHVDHHVRPRRSTTTTTAADGATTTTAPASTTTTAADGEGETGMGMVGSRRGRRRPARAVRPPPPPRCRPPPSPPCRPPPRWTPPPPSPPTAPPRPPSRRDRRRPAAPAAPAASTPPPPPPPRCPAAGAPPAGAVLESSRRHRPLHPRPGRPQR